MSNNKKIITVGEQNSWVIIPVAFSGNGTVEVYELLPCGLEMFQGYSTMDKVLKVAKTVKSYSSF